ncbi:MAG: outer membrane protein transport protein [Proteobacteria bacterium]|nr:outer membrane protein transport protein [Pseudomonadota bacterium]
MKRSMASFMLAGAAFSLASQKLWAAGFAVRAQSASSLGTAGASDTAGNEDISAIFSNPASIAAFSGQRLSLGFAAAKVDAKFKDGQRTLPVLGTPVSKEEKNSSDNFTKDASVPAVFGVHQINETVNLGWSLTVPYGTSTDYGKDWVGRYHGIKTDLNVLNFDLGASYKVAENLSLGFGVQVQKANGNISGASNLGGVGGLQTINAVSKALAAAATGDNSQLAQLDSSAQALATAVSTAATKAGTAATQAGNSADEIKAASNAAGAAVLNAAVASADGTNDVLAVYDGSDVAAGFNFGVLYRPLTDLNLGFSYRSQVKHKNKGDINFSGETATASAYVASQGYEKDASLDLTMPDVISLAANYQGIQNVKLFANLTQTRWSSVEGLNVKYRSSQDGDKNILVKLAWKDVYSAALGAAYQLNPQIVLRTGAALDKSPVEGSLRSPRSADNDRTLLSLGAGYAADAWQLDFGYTHTAIKEPKLALKENDYPEAAYRGDLSGTYAVSANTFMLQYSQAL